MLQKPLFIEGVTAMVLCRGLSSIILGSFTLLTQFLLDSNVQLGTVADLGVS